MKTLWGGRFAEPLDERILAFSGSFPFDVRLLPHDLRGSMAHARMLGSVGLLTPEEEKALLEALKNLAAEAAAGLPTDSAGAEDVHSWVENRLRETLGDLSGKLHTARSRNDQVALDLRLFLGQASRQVREALAELRRALIDRAQEHQDTVMPGYTHLQPAQPVLLSHHLLAYQEMLQRDAGRFRDARRRGDECPLGAGALAGTTLPIDRHFTARELGFAAPTRNSLDTVSERDFPLEFTAAAAITMIHLSRLAEEFVLWSSPAYGFLTLPDRLATGSSMMPQKKNPDAAELSRGKAGRVIGNLTALLVVLKGLPLAYQRDLQEDKENLFDTVDTLLGCLGAMTLYVRQAVFDAGRMALEAGRGHSLATDLAEYLVVRRMPFRQAHEVVGRLVRLASERGVEIHELPLADLQAQCDLFGADALELMSPLGSVRAKRSFGSTSPTLVAGALREARTALDAEQTGDPTW